MRSTIDKIVMDETKKEEIRQNLLKKRTANRTWVKVTATVAAAAAALMMIPFTRNKILQAAENLYSSFKGKNGGEVRLIVDENNEIISADVKNGADYVQVIANRMYLVMDEDKIDITDQCSESEYYRYEIKKDDGTYELIYVGGTIDDYGWMDVIIKPDFLDNRTVSTCFTGGHADPETLTHEWQIKADNDVHAYIHLIDNAG